MTSATAQTIIRACLQSAGSQRPARLPDELITGSPFDVMRERSTMYPAARLWTFTNAAVTVHAWTFANGDKLTETAAAVKVSA